ncbi:CDP-alcohol phosphatidyltransferase family protein [soil metagenome]
MNTADLTALALVLALLLTMPVFAMARRNRVMDSDVARRGSTVLLGYWLRDWLMWLIGPVERTMVRVGISPDVFNYLGLLLAAGAGLAFARGALGIAGWLVLLGGAADVFDGRIARARGLANSYGAFLDSTLDRFAETLTFLGLIVYFAAVPVMVLATAAALGGSLLVSYTRARGEALGITGSGGVMQRAERLVLLAVGSILDPTITSRAGWGAGTVLAIVLILIAVGTAGTAIYRTVSIARMLRRG